MQVPQAMVLWVYPEIYLEFVWRQSEFAFLCADCGWRIFYFVNSYERQEGELFLFHFAN